MNRKRSFLTSWMYPAMAIIALLGGSKVFADNPECAGTSPYVCVFKAGDDPVPGVHFIFDFTDPGNPDITLKTGNLGWKVWSQVSVSDTTPANIGDIKIDATLPADVFEMSLLNATGGPGAANVGSIILSDPDPLWTGHSSITTGEITGDLTNRLPRPP